MKSSKNTNAAVNPPKKRDTTDYLRANLFWLAVIFSVFFPILDQLILQTAVLSVDGNIAYENLSEVLETLLNILSAVATYANYAVLACATAYYGSHTGGTVLISFATHPITLICELFSYSFASGSDPDTVAVFIIDCLLNILLHAVIYGILLLMHRRIRDKKLPPLGGKLFGKHGLFPFITVTSLIFGGLQFFSVLITMIIDFLDPSLGLPQNSGEVVYLITEHLSTLIFLAIGYFAALAIAYFSQYVIRHFSD